MTADSLPGLGAVRRRRGVSRSMTDRTLTAWRKGGTLSGDEHAATRSAIRDAAEAVDAARDSVREARADGASARAVAECARAQSAAARTLFELIAAVVPHDTAGGDGDSLDAFLASLSGPAVRD